MISRMACFIAAAIFTLPLEASPRLLPRADDPSLELMECGHLPRYQRESPLRIPHQAGMELMECRPPIVQSDQRDSGSSSLAGSANLPAGPRLSSSSDDNTIHSADHPGSSSQQQLDTALVRPVSQSMDSGIEMADLGLLGPSHVDSSAPDRALPAPASDTSIIPSRATCIQCVQSCVGSYTNATEAVGQYCARARDNCGHDEQGVCAVVSLTCCTFLTIVYAAWPKSY